MKRDKRLEIRISKGLRRALERHADREGIPVSRIVRVAIMNYLKSNKVIK